MGQGLERRKEMESMKLSLRAARVNKGFTLQEAAEKLGVCANTVQNWEKGKSMPRMDKFRKLCRLYGVEEKYIS